MGLAKAIAERRQGYCPMVSAMLWDWFVTALLQSESSRRLAVNRKGPLRKLAFGESPPLPANPLDSGIVDTFVLMTKVRSE
ncbi:hypothetical protein NKH28_20260 [Mesorhizobium sp. M1227]|uniref:hypothetical protein n=1 Tax=Mesorhizobium sp. M1227 TaxID=2957071 RepID=UPI00333D07B6